MNYRPDIDGLRAIAVITVLIFHLNANLLPGGFIGVDIFFVISGFLITNIIIKEVDEGRFSFKKFYVRRMKRLLPLFFSIVIFSLIIGYFIFLPFDYKSLSKDVIASDFFLANVKTAFTTNYFTNASQVPLLHLWSLAVEEQFYLFFPFLYLSIYNRWRKYIPIIFIVFLVISLCLSEYLSSIDRFSNYSYLLLPTRAWEMLAGCLLAIMSPKVIDDRKWSNITAGLGLILLIVGFVFINNQSVFPGFITILPVLGTLLIIKAGGDNYVGILLKNSVFVYVGLASYSIYMWHYPIIAFFKSFYEIDRLTTMQFVVLFSLILLVGFISKRCIEDFFRFNKLIDFWKISRNYLIIPLILTTSFSVFIFTSNGIPSRFKVDSEMIVPFTKLCPFYNPFGCYLTNNESSDNQVMLLGDSHAEHFTDFFTHWLNEGNESLSLYAAGGCAFYSKQALDVKCENLKAKVVEDVEKFNTVIISSRFDIFYKNDSMVEEFKSYLEDLASKGKKVIVLAQVPQFKDKKFVKSLLFNKRYNLPLEENIFVVNDSYSIANSKVLDQLKSIKGITVLDLNPLLLVNGKISVVDENRNLLYYDDNHLSAYAAEYMLNKMKYVNGPKTFLEYISNN